jgi:hypothetical protein
MLASVCTPSSWTIFSALPAIFTNQRERERERGRERERKRVKKMRERERERERESIYFIKE